MEVINIYKLSFVLGALAVSTVSYLIEHARRKYSEGKSKEIASPRHFVTVYHAIQIAVVIGVVDAATTVFGHFGVIFDSQWATVIGSIITVVGLTIFVIAKRQLGRNYAPCFDAFVPTGIVQTGIYRFIRHPIYTANLAVIIGFSLITGHILVIASFVALLGYYIVSARIEEEALSKEFTGYAAYKQSTRRFIPFVV